MLTNGLTHKSPLKNYLALLLSGLVIILGLSACSSGNSTTYPLDTGGLGDSDEITPQAVLAAVDWLGQQTGVNINEIEIVDFEEVDWPDSCLGVGKPEQSCAAVITPGYRVLLLVNNQQYEIRTDVEGIVIVQSPSSETSP